MMKWTGLTNMETDSNTIEVGELWAQIELMESQRRFDGHAYPGGQGPFPFRLAGQGFSRVERVCGGKIANSRSNLPKRSGEKG
jgi:hypothetical protein